MNHTEARSHLKQTTSNVITYTPHLLLPTLNNFPSSSSFECYPRKRHIWQRIPIPSPPTPNNFPSPASFQFSSPQTPYPPTNSNAVSYTPHIPLPINSRHHHLFNNLPHIYRIRQQIPTTSPTLPTLHSQQFPVISIFSMAVPINAVSANKFQHRHLHSPLPTLDNFPLSSFEWLSPQTPYPPMTSNAVTYIPQSPFPITLLRINFPPTSPEKKFYQQFIIQQLTLHKLHTQQLQTTNTSPLQWLHSQESTANKVSSNDFSSNNN